MGPIEAAWQIYQPRSYGKFDSIRVTIYELGTPVEVAPPFYFNRRKLESQI